MEKKKSLNISCSTVTLDVFIRCVLHNGLRLLSETATDAELQEAWENLYDEYAQKTGGIRSKYVFGLTEKIAVLEARIATYAAAMGMSQENRDKILKELGYKENHLAQHKREVVELKTAALEKERLMSSNGEGMTEDDFTRWVNVVSKFMGYRINRKEVTVAEFLDMSEIMEKSNREAKKNGR